MKVAGRLKKCLLTSLREILTASSMGRWRIGKLYSTNIKKFKSQSTSE